MSQFFIRTGSRAWKHGVSEGQCTYLHCPLQWRQKRWNNGLVNNCTSFCDKFDLSSRHMAIASVGTIGLLPKRGHFFRVPRRDLLSMLCLETFIIVIILVIWSLMMSQFFIHAGSRAWKDSPIHNFISSLSWFLSNDARSNETIKLWTIEHLFVTNPTSAVGTQLLAQLDCR